ncbi:MAG TPA: hypothetical protein VGU20_26785 [Stellaceae bacterium]|nr:hypothetical protein [Stellaceae bacterium]
MAEMDGSRLEARQFAPVFLALFAFAAAPVVLCDTLPLFDYPNHLARMHILARLGESPALQSYYEIVWRPLPNLAMDAVVPVLAHMMPLAWAGKVFILATFLLLAGGTAVLHRTIFGRWSLWSCLAFLLLYSRTLLWGFLNYLFGLGLALLAFAALIALARRPALPRLLVGTAAALALFFAHLLAFGLFAVMIAGYELGLAWRGRAEPVAAIARLAWAALPFLPTLALLLLASPGSAAGALSFGNPLRKLDLLFSVFDNYHRPFDIACFAAVLLAAALAFWRRWAKLDASMALPLVAMALTYLAMPNRIATAAGADHRIPLLLGLLLIAGSRWTAPARPLGAIFAAAAALLFAVRIGLVALSWQASDRIYAALLPAIDQLPVGGRLAVAYPSEAINSEATPLAHFPLLAVVRRDAFVPTLFAFPTQQPVALRPDARMLADRLPPERLWSALVEGASLDAGERAALATYDHVIVVGRHPFAVAAAPPLVPVFAQPRLQLLAVGDKAPLPLGKP